MEVEEKGEFRESELCLYNAYPFTQPNTAKLNLLSKNNMFRNEFYWELSLFFSKINI